jgi:glycosyltransferase involved in cell wall biosynthesis
LISAEKQSFALPSGPSILYLSLDGMLEPLGRSQVLSYIYKLTDAGFSFAIISLEREQDINAAAVSRLSRELRARNIEWRWERFQQGGIRPAFRNLRNLFRQARSLSRVNRFAAIHARSFPPALVARLLKLTNGIPYLFDLRGCWVEEKAAEGAWVTNPLAFSFAKMIERDLIEDAFASVTLTAIHADDIKARSRKTLVSAIPTCADYDLFIRNADQDVLPDKVVVALRDKLVIGMVGSVSKSYRTREALQLFSEIRRLRPDAHLLCVTRQISQMKAMLKELGIADSDHTMLSSDHEQMPAWMSLMDWALLLLSDGEAKRGSMPTKLPEYFAAGVRVVQYGCNREVADHVRQCGAGIVLPDLSIEELRRAAQHIASEPRFSDSTAKARTLTRAHFGLEAGTRKYQDLFNRIIQTQPRSTSRAAQQGHQ